MVINRTEEMDEQNKQMVRQIPNLPKTGKINAKARVVKESGNLIYDIYNVKTSVKEENIDLSGKQLKKEVKNELPSESEKIKESQSLSDDQQKDETKVESSSDTENSKESLNINSEQSREETKKESIAADTQGNSKDNTILNDKQQNELTSGTTVTNLQKQGNAGSLELNEKISE